MPLLGVGPPAEVQEGLTHNFDTPNDIVLEDGPPPAAPPPYYASDAFLASLYCEEDDIFPINFSRLFEQKLTIPAYMGGMNRKAADVQAQRNVIYFESEHEELGSGPASLVARVKHWSASKASDIEPTEALFVLLNTWLVNDLGPKQLAVYTSLMSHALASKTRKNQTETESNNLPSSGTLLCIPVGVNAAKNELLTGTRSIMVNVARPYTHTLRNGYSYVSCIDSLACLLGSGVKFEPLIGRSSPFMSGKEGQFAVRFNADTPRGAEILANAEAILGPEAFAVQRRIPTIILLAFLWSDGFEPNATKQNRGSVHAFLLTFGFNQDDPHSGTTTVLLALGPGDAKTDDVEALLKQELEKLMKPTGEDNLFYVGESRTVCRVFVQLYSLQEDRMERQSATRVLGGTSNHTARWGWLADLSFQQHFLPSCSICYQGLLANVDTSDYRAACGCCANWEMEGLTYPPPPDYPIDRLPADSPELPYRKLTFEGMTLAYREAYLKVSTAAWKISVGETFLKTEGVNAQFGGLVLMAASNRLKLNSMDPHSDTYRAHLLLSQAYNSTFPVELPEKPATWCYPGVSIFEHIDVIMHLMFLGIVSTVLKETVFLWLKAHRLMSDLAQLTRKPLTELDLMSLAWCKALIINDAGTLGSAVSENYLCYCRLGKWLFGCSSILRATDLVYSDPCRPLETYTVVQIKAWYSAREIPLPRLDNNEELKVQFLEDNAVEGGPPGIPEKGEAGISREVADDLINSMVALVAHVMVEGEVGDEEVWAVERHVKLFLSTYDRFDDYRRRRVASRPVQNGRSMKKKKAAWISHMNFASLLNLPGVMRRYGSLRVLWEGDRKGEGGLPRLKSQVKKGVTGNWSSSACRSVLCETALERAIQSAACSVGTDSSDQSVQQLLDAAKLVVGHEGTRVYKNYKKYDNEPQALQALASGSPISLVILKSDSSWGIIIRGGKVLPITLVLGDAAEVIGGAAYHKFEHGEPRELILGDGEFMEADAISKYALLLPQLANGDFPGRHYLITSNWEELDLAGNIVRYRMEGAAY
jgi:hypothetical protein